MAQRFNNRPGQIGDLEAPISQAQFLSQQSPERNRNAPFLAKVDDLHQANRGDVDDALAPESLSEKSPDSVIARRPQADEAISWPW